MSDRDARDAPSLLEEPATFDLVTWNVHSWVGLDLRRDPIRVLSLLGRLDADVIALQEVEGRDWIELARAAGYHVHCGPPPGRDDFGNALLTRRAPEACRLIDLSVGGGLEPRAAIDAVLAVETVGAPRLRVVTTHLGLRAAERRRQSQHLASHLGDVDPTLPVVLLGDLNDWTPWGAQLAPLARRVGRLSRGRTFPSRRPVFALDRVAWRIPGARAEVGVLRSPELRAASDHLPLRLRLRLEAPPTEETDASLRVAIGARPAATAHDD